MRTDEYVYRCPTLYWSIHGAVEMLHTCLLLSNFQQILVHTCSYLHVHVHLSLPPPLLQWNTRHGELLPYTDFHIEVVTDVVDFVADFFNWIEAKVRGRSEGRACTCTYT